MTEAPPLAGVIGNPISHSKSPLLFDYWLRRLDLQGHYVPMHVERSDLKTVLEALPKAGFRGVNVTVPFKEEVLGLADLATDRAAIIGAANTLIFRADGRIHADNTDGYGFIENIRSAQPDWTAVGGPTAVLGAGGAARAVVSTLLEAGSPEVRVANRTRARAERLKSDFGIRVTVWDWTQAGVMMEGAITVINTTSLGMVGKAPLKLSLDELTPTAVVNDIVYAPVETELLKRARAQGCRVVDGLGMLLHQALPGFERWFGQRPVVDENLRRAVLAGW